jgi:hypothetical protein
MSLQMSIRWGMIATAGLALSATACAEVRHDEPLAEILFGNAESVTAQTNADPPAPPAASDYMNGLPPQDLAPGECGAFFWDRAEPNPLLVFDNESRGDARLWLNGETVAVASAVRSFDYRAGERLERRYGNVSIAGEITDRRNGEAVIGRALMRVRDGDGRETVTPMVGLISCRE